MIRTKQEYQEALNIILAKAKVYDVIMEGSIEYKYGMLITEDNEKILKELIDNYKEN